jgi:hypothetical protein
MQPLALGSEARDSAMVDDQSVDPRSVALSRRSVSGATDQLARLQTVYLTLETRQPLLEQLTLSL